MSIKFGKFIILVLGTLLSCTEPPDETRIATMTNAANRVTAINEVVAWDTTVTLGKASGQPTDSLLLILEAEVSPPSLEGVSLQATDISIHGSKAYVSYNIQGENFGGGVDVFDISDINEPELIGGILIDDSDVNGLYVHGNEMFLAIAKEPGADTEYAALEIIQLSGGIPETNSEIINLPSWAATDVVVSGNNVFVTTGAENGYICILDRSNLTFIDSIQVDDARGVSVESQTVAVIAGTPARLFVFDGDAGELLGEYSLTGASIPFSKSTVEIIGGKALVGIGDGGTNIVCLGDGVGSVLAELAAPSVVGLAPELTVTNAVTAQGDIVFMANGEAGVYVGQTDRQLTSNNCNIDELNLVGKLIFDEDQSVNHVAYRSGVLFIASGLGGLKIVSIED